MKSERKDIIKLEKVSKIYQMSGEQVIAIDDISLRINNGDFISILGPSGSGKSTLLHIVGLLDEPTKGRVYIDEIETSTLDESSRAYLRGKKIGFVFQVFNLIQNLTVLENVALPALIYNSNEQIAEQKAVEILKKIGMGDRLFHYPSQLSGGQRQRVAIARALINDPEVLLADEPTGNLDSKTGEDVLSMFKELNKNGKTIIIITHDPNITKITKRTIQIKDGRVSN